MVEQGDRYQKSLRTPSETAPTVTARKSGRRRKVGALGSVAVLLVLGLTQGRIGDGAPPPNAGQQSAASKTNKAAKPIPRFQNPFDCRKADVRRQMLDACGGNDRSEKAVAAALDWLARHQNDDGSWTVHAYNQRCKDATCTGVGTIRADAAATALALLPFLGDGQTHLTDGPHKTAISKGLETLMKAQKRDGSLWGDSPERMYSHGLGTIALCEAYGLTRDKKVGRAAQAAINYIQWVQHPRTGGWRYDPGDEGDTSVTGWQVQALRTGQAAGLDVSLATLAGAKHWLTLCVSGKEEGLCAYTPGRDPSPSMTAVGLLLREYGGAAPDDRAVKEGASYLASQKPDIRRRDLYCWYYATKAMYNLRGPEWDAWNGPMQRVLIDSQVKSGCAAGSWDPRSPTREVLGDGGGRLCVTSLAALTLQVYYRFPPLAAQDKQRRPE